MLPCLSAVLWDLAASLVDEGLATTAALPPSSAAPKIVTSAVSPDKDTSTDMLWGDNSSDTGQPGAGHDAGLNRRFSNQRFTNP